MVTAYLQSLKQHNRGQRVIVGTVEARTGATIRIPDGLKEPRAGSGSNSSNALLTWGGGCLFTLLLLGLLPFIFPFLRNQAVIVLVIAGGIGFFAASRLKNVLLRPYRTQVDNAQSRWRRARWCASCDLVFIPDEPAYTSPESLNQLVWTPSLQRSER